MEEQQPDLTNVQSAVHDVQSTKEGHAAKREDILARKRELSRSIREKIGLLKEARHKRDELTVKVREAKEQRTVLNDEIKKKIVELKTIPQEKHEARPEGRYGGRRDGREMRGDSPRYLREQIEKMEFKIEHEGVSFDKERTLMKAIKDMKRKLETAVESSKQNKQAHALSSEIRKLKHDADAVHDELQTFAKSSQEYHTQLLKLSEELDQLKKEEQELEDTYKDIIKDIQEDAEMLKEKYSVLHQLQGEIKKKKQKQKEEKQKAETQILKELESEVKEKLKQGKKLTTEDLLILQKTDTD
ncbi:MAG: hypothetical protein V1725_04910 [archaeon]